jgi:UDP-glucose 4-epimerase
MKILITGGAGFIGSHLCDKHVKNKDTVICLDNFLSGELTNIRHLLNYRNFKLVNGDIRNYDLLEKLMRDVDAVFHLAAQIHVDRSIIEPRLTYDINVLGTQNIMEISRMYDVEKIIHMSTSEVYGSAQYAPMDENHPLDAPHPYGASKIAADRLCYAYINTYGMNICIMRPFNLYGPHQKDHGYGGVISLFTKRVLSGMPPIIYGSGEQTRDYTYVEDILDAYEIVMKHPHPIREPVNFGTGVDIKINDLATKIIYLCGKDICPIHVAGRPGEVQRLITGTKRAESLGWKPRHSLDEGLKKFIDWYKNYKSEEWAKPG